MGIGIGIYIRVMTTSESLKQYVYGASAVIETYDNMLIVELECFAARQVNLQRDSFRHDYITVDPMSSCSESPAYYLTLVVP